MSVGGRPDVNAARRGDYGLDAPGVIRNLALVAAVVGVLAVFAPSITVGSVRFVVRPMIATVAALCVLEAGLMWRYSRIGKFAHRDRMLGMVTWRGDEQVLDVGTGRGLLLVGAAKRLTSGRAIGIDLWSAKDLSDNGPEGALRNAEREGVRDRVEVRTGDARKLELPAASVDVVLSNLCLHNIPDAAGRAQAVREIVRVLKPGGVAVISDFRHVEDYAREFEAAGCTVQRHGPDWLRTFPPLGRMRSQKGKG